MKQLAALAALVFVFSAEAAENQNLLVTTTWLQQHLLDRTVAVLEIGDRAAYEEAHIPNARLVALSDLLKSVDGTANELPAAGEIEKVFRAAGITDRARIILYSREPIAAARAFFTLDYAGHGDRTAILDGGFAKWAGEGRRVEAGASPDVEPGDFQVRPRAEAVVRMAALKILVKCADSLGSNFVLIDTRSADQFDSGHIPCATNIPWQENLTAEHTPTFKSPAELKALYSGSGLAQNASVVTYCRTGMQASVTYFVLRYLGQDVHLYDGSYSEWSKK